MVILTLIPGKNIKQIPSGSNSRGIMEKMIMETQSMYQGHAVTAKQWNQVVATYVTFSFPLGYLIKAHLHTYNRETAAGRSPNTLHLGYTQAHHKSHQSMKCPFPQAQRSKGPQEQMGMQIQDLEKRTLCRFSKLVI